MSIKISQGCALAMTASRSSQPFRSLIEAIPMSEPSISTTTKKLAKFYAIGILAFSAIVGFITVFAKFLSYLRLT